MITTTLMAAGDISATANTTIVAAASIGQMVNNAINWVRGIGAGLFVLAGMAHLIKKAFSQEFTLTALAKTGGIVGAACVVFFLLPTIVESFTGAGRDISQSGGGGGVF
ncbi:hypothetical protein [Mycobacteroides abscessus]|uniref:Uncharacterized protein n=1 Tax=Mycobacteroides abscessus TaxID=36809 RepID=A0A0U0ZR67_9MYCO|nr:hypothetical protein [Mycobacteroides abscessus]CPV66071.1 Uncharacterised protein [Mycobacteroides abscessus]